MKKLLIGVLLCTPLVALDALADGKELYMSLECKSCHDPEKDQVSIGLGPSLQRISGAYQNDEPGLVQFLKGKAKPRVSPENYMVMETQLAMILYGKPEENLRKLAQFILSHKPVVPAPVAPPAAAAEAAPATAAPAAVPVAPPAPPAVAPPVAAPAAAAPPAPAAQPPPPPAPVAPAPAGAAAPM